MAVSRLTVRGRVAVGDVAVVIVVCGRDGKYVVVGGVRDPNPTRFPRIGGLGLDATVLRSAGWAEVGKKATNKDVDPGARPRSTSVRLIVETVSLWELDLGRSSRIVVPLPRLLKSVESSS